MIVLRGKRGTLLVDILFFLSALAMIRLLALKGDYLPFPIRAAVALVCALAAAFVGRAGSRALSGAPLGALLGCVVFGLVSAANMTLNFYRTYREILPAQPVWAGHGAGKLLTAALGAAAIPAAVLCYLWLWRAVGPVLARAWRALGRAERRYWLVSVAVCAVAIFLVYSRTSAFSYPVTADGVFEGYDVVYNSDTGSQIDTKIHLNIGANQSDIRQPLYGLFAQTVGVAAELLSRALFFLPHSYTVVLAVLQAALLQFALLLVCLMALPRAAESTRVCLMLVLNASFPFLLFSLNMEQYVLSVFWLVLFLFAALGDEPQPRRDALFIAATGSILTSGALFPLLPGGRSLGQKVRETAHAAGKALVIGGLFARYSLLFAGPTSLRYLLTNFSGVGKLTLTERLYQYSHFLRACLLAPGGVVDPVFKGWPSYQPAEVTGLSLLGAAVLVLALAGFLLRAREPFAQVCAYWMAFSFVILGLVGWGSTENGMVLYTLYFSWALIALVVMGAQRILPARVLRVVLAVAACALLALNLYGMRPLILFGIQYYPAV